MCYITMEAMSSMIFHFQTCWFFITIYVTLPEGHQNILGKYHNNSVTNLERETSGASYASTFIQITFIVYGTFYIILQYTLFFFHFWEAPKKIAHRTSLNRIFNFRGLIWRECWALTTFIWGVHMPPVVQCAICLGAFKMWTPAYPERISQWIVIVPDILDSKW